MKANETFPMAFPEASEAKAMRAEPIVQPAMWRRYGQTVLRLDAVLAFQFTPASEQAAAELVVEYGGSRMVLADHHAMQAWMDLQVLALGKPLNQGAGVE